MSFNVTLLPAEGDWGVDLDAFARAARDRFPDAEVGSYRAETKQSVQITTSPPEGGDALSATFLADSGAAATFSIRNGTSPAAAEMFAWVRDWLGPQRRCLLYIDDYPEAMTEVANGTPPADLLRILTETTS